MYLTLEFLSYTIELYFYLLILLKKHLLNMLNIFQLFPTRITTIVSQNFTIIVK